jgi:hypothetical protein
LQTSITIVEANNDDTLEKYAADLPFDRLDEMLFRHGTLGFSFTGVALVLILGLGPGLAALITLAAVYLPIGFLGGLAADWWVYGRWMKGLHLNIPNDLYNDFSRRIGCESGEQVLTSPPEDAGAVQLARHDPLLVVAQHEPY